MYGKKNSNKMKRKLEAPKPLSMVKKMKGKTSPMKKTKKGM